MALTPIEGPPDPNGADCVACGRCCFHEPRTVSVYVDDEARLGPERLEQLSQVEPRPPFYRFLRVVDGHCIALRVTDEPSYPCSIYPVRPQGCRTVAPGSRPCLEARRLGHLGTCNDD